MGPSGLVITWNGCSVFISLPIRIGSEIGNSGFLGVTTKYIKDSGFLQANEPMIFCDLRGRRMGFDLYYDRFDSPNRATMLCWMISSTDRSSDKRLVDEAS